MIHESYFDDAFILHDESERQLKYINRIIEHVNKVNETNNSSVKPLELLDPPKNDTREFLRFKWANLKRMFSPQPLWEIRDYFGELNAYYFAWIGTFVSTLWLITILGVAALGYGLKEGFCFFLD